MAEIEIDEKARDAAVTRLAYGYELMHTTLCHIAGTSGADRHWYVHKAQEVTERITRVGEVTKDSNPAKHGDCLRGYRQFALAYEAAKAAPGEAVPAGWKLVPIKPTKAMMSAVDVAYDAFEASTEGAWCGAASVYAAMLAASPAPPPDATAAGGVAVKAVAWEPYWGGGNDDIPSWRASTPVGLTLDVDFAGERLEKHSDADPIRLAAKKAEAFAWYETRIRSTLVPAAGGVDAVREAFIAGWWINAATPGEDGAGDKAYFDGCAEVDWQEYLAALASPAPSETGGLHGPFGYLVIDPELNEEHWRFADDPDSDPALRSIAVFTKEDPFALSSAPSQGGKHG